MFTKRSLTMTLTLVLALMASHARAQENRPLTSQVIEMVGQVVITAVRPSTLTAESGYEPRVTSHSFASPKAGRLDVTINMRWHGAFTRNRYDSRFTVKIHADRSGVEVLGIDYTDNCVFPAPDVRLLNSAIQVLNDVLTSRRQ